jgi:hypothetical protein
VLDRLIPTRKLRRSIYLSLSALLWTASTPAWPKPPENFLFLGSDELSASRTLLERPDIAGAQIVYSWRRLEPVKGRYNFEPIEADLKVAEQAGKKLFVQVQDRFFSASARNLPEYLLKDPEYRGGLARQIDNPGEGKPQAAGWVAMQWHAPVQARFQALLAALAKRFDGRVYGVNLPETAADLADPKADGFSCDSYFNAALANIVSARRAFRRSHVVQYVNFWPCEWNNDRRYMSRFFEFAIAESIGLGGPDIIPYRRGQMKNAYPFFNRHRGKLPIVAMAVQQPTLTYRNPTTKRPFTRDEIVAFADDYLGVDVIFWTAEAPWLRAARRP